MFYTLSENCYAEENPANVSIIGEPTYKLKNTFEKNGRIIGKTFQIDIIFSNTGDFKSDEIEINLTDQEGFVLSQRTFFIGGETRIISFNWSTMIIKDQVLKINFYPSDVDTSWNKYNSGHKTLAIKVSDNGIPSTSTPGFEIFLLIITVIGITFLIKKRN